MVYEHIVVLDGVWYEAGENVPGNTIPVKDKEKAAESVAISDETTTEKKRGRKPIAR